MSAGDTSLVSLDANQAATLALRDFNFLAGLAMPNVYEFPFPPIYGAVWQLLWGSANTARDFSKFAIGLPRGHAKTTWIKLFILALILFSNKKFILIVCATDDLAENFIGDIAAMLDEDNIRSIWGNWDYQRTKNTNGHKEFFFCGRKIQLRGLGAGSSMRGIVRGNERPDLILMDDIQKREEADSQELSEKLVNWMMGTLQYTRSPRGCQYVFLGNMYPTKYSILRMLKENKYWTSFVVGAILADGKALWEDLHPLSLLLEELAQLEEAGKADIFMSELMNDSETLGITNFDETKLAQWTHDSEPHQGSFIVIDPATNKKGSDPQAITRYELHNGKPWAVEILEGHWSPGDLIKETFQMCFRSGCSLVTVESVAYQSTLLYWFDITAKQLGISGIYFREVFTRGVTKNARIMKMLKSLMAKEIGIGPKVKSLVLNKIANFNPKVVNNDDAILDTLVYCYQAIELYSPLITVWIPGDAMELETVLDEDETSAI
jgi:hypothetical protein